jgi:excisionase family DNA binding protein
MNQMTMTFQRQITRTHIPNRKAMNCINALNLVGLSDLDIADLIGISRDRLREIRQGGNVRRSTFERLKKARRMTANNAEIKSTTVVLDKGKQRQATIAALDSLNLAGWTDEMISETIYSKRSNDRKRYIKNVRNGALMTEKVFNRLVSLAESVCNGSAQVNHVNSQAKAIAQADSEAKKKPSKIIDGERFYSVQEIGELVGVHGHTVRKYIKTGELQARRIGYSFWVSEGNLNLWLAYLRGRADKPKTAIASPKSAVLLQPNLWQRLKRWIVAVYNISR